MIHKYLDARMSESVHFHELVTPGGRRPPSEPGVYAVTLGMVPIYVGKTKAKGGLRDRITALVVCAIGLTDGEWFIKHAGGKHICRWFEEREPEAILDLEIQWVANPPCVACAEHEVWAAICPRLNRQKVGACAQHEPALKLEEVKYD